MTSNVGSQVIQQVTEEGGDEEEMRTAVQGALRARFLPEFLNRVDDTVIFHPLEREQISQIVRIQLRDLSHRLEQNGLKLLVTDEAVSQIAETGFDPLYGARPLKRVIQREVQNPLATALLKNSYPEGSTIEVGHNGSEFTFSAVSSEQSERPELV